MMLTLCASTVVHAQQVTTIAQNIILPLGIAVDASQAVYVTNRQAHNITKIAPDGSLSMFSSAYNGLVGVAVDAGNTLNVADYQSWRVRKIIPAPSASETKEVS